MSLTLDLEKYQIPNNWKEFVIETELGSVNGEKWLGEKSKKEGVYDISCSMVTSFVIIEGEKAYILYGPDLIEARDKNKHLNASIH